MACFAHVLFKSWLAIYCSKESYSKILHGRIFVYFFYTATMIFYSMKRVEGTISMRMTECFCLQSQICNVSELDLFLTYLRSSMIWWLSCEKHPRVPSMRWGGPPIQFHLCSIACITSLTSLDEKTCIAGHVLRISEKRIMLIIEIFKTTKKPTCTKSLKAISSLLNECF